jgi:hypothetical protein
VKNGISYTMNLVRFAPARFRVPPRPGISGEFGNSPERERWRAGNYSIKACSILKSSIKTLTDFSHLMKPGALLENVGLAIPKGGNRQMLDLLVANSNKTLAELVMA